MKRLACILLVSASLLPVAAQEGLPVTDASAGRLNAGDAPPRRPLDVDQFMRDIAPEPIQQLPLAIPDELRFSPAELEIVRMTRAAFELSSQLRWQEALPLFVEVTRRDPDNKSARFGLGTTYISLSRYAEAIELFNDMIAEFPSDYYVLNNLAWLYATAADLQYRDGQKALELAQKALLIAPADYHVWSTLSEAYFIMGEYQRSLRAAFEAHQIANLQKAPANYIKEYRDQIAKSRRAALALSILE